MITPIWADEMPMVPGWTSFHLHLEKHGQELVTDIEAIKPSVLLFLRKLRSLTVEVAVNNTAKTIQIDRYETNDPDVIRLERLLNGILDFSEHYLLIKHTIEPYQHEPERKNIEQSEIVLAFPITHDGWPITRMQEVHAFLPLRSCGFNVRPLVSTPFSSVNQNSVHHPSGFFDICKQGGHQIRPDLEHYSSSRGVGSLPHCSRTVQTPPLSRILLD